MNFQAVVNQDRNWNADTAWACTVYSMVPYLGILFVPIALAVSLFGYIRFRRQSSHDPRRFVFYAVLSLVILAVQILFWWLLYFIPKIGL